MVFFSLWLHSEKITDDVLDLSRLSSGKMTLNMEAVSHSAHQINCGDVHGTGHERTPSILTCDLPIAPPLDAVVVECDPHRLSQVLINLLSNAIKFTTKSTVRRVNVRLNLEPLNDDCINVCVAVSDTGIGISKEELATLFKRFHQANVTTYSCYGGSGLGLHITKLVLGHMGGDITVTSQPGKGSCFTIIVPCRVQRNAVGDLVNLTNTISAHDLNILGKCACFAVFPTHTHTLLTYVFGIITVVEDNDINQKVLRCQLETTEQFRCTTQIANNGLEAVEMYKRGDPTFDVILMDMQMPVLDGLEATRRIREYEASTAGKQQHVPIIGISGNARDVCWSISVSVSVTNCGLLIRCMWLQLRQRE